MSPGDDEVPVELLGQRARHAAGGEHLARVDHGLRLRGGVAPNPVDRLVDAPVAVVHQRQLVARRHRGHALRGHLRQRVGKGRPAHRGAPVHSQLWLVALERRAGRVPEVEVHARHHHGVDIGPRGEPAELHSQRRRDALVGIDDQRPLTGRGVGDHVSNGLDDRHRGVRDHSRAGAARKLG
jgi:hypothetical protein